jgi:hypothetical protein
MNAEALAEMGRALDVLRGAMEQAIRDGDRDLYASLANRYGRLHGRWEEATRALRQGRAATEATIAGLEEARRVNPEVLRRPMRSTCDKADCG